MTESFDENYWTTRYEQGQTGWDVGNITTPLKDYFDQLIDKHISILIPGAGNAWEARYLVENGFTKVTVCDISPLPLQSLSDCKGITCIHGDFFHLDTKFDLIIEQTFFCALHPSLRLAYVEKMYDLLEASGKLVGLLFNTTFEKAGPPFGGRKDDYQILFGKYFNFLIFETAYNSIPPRSNNELFVILEKKILAKSSINNK